MASVIKLIQGDITEVKCDAIVNAANPGLFGGKGVCGAIYAKAGTESLDKYNSRFYSHGCHTGEAVLSPAFGLQESRICDYIIHAVGPDCRVYKCSEVQQALLAMAYASSIRVAELFGLVSISFPTISTGVYGFDVQKAARIMVNTVREELKHTEAVNKVNLVAYDDDQYAIIEELLKSNP